MISNTEAKYGHRVALVVSVVARSFALANKLDADAFVTFTLAQHDGWRAGESDAYLASLVDAFVGLQAIESGDNLPAADVTHDETMARIDANIATVKRLADMDTCLAPIADATPVGTPVVALFGMRDAAGEYRVGRLIEVVTIDGELCATAAFRNADGTDTMCGGAADAFREWLPVDAAPAIVEIPRYDKVTGRILPDATPADPYVIPATSRETFDWYYGGQS